MTGRDFIIYILENGLENERLFENNKLTGFMTAQEAAAECDVGIETIKVWFERDIVHGIKLGDEIYILSKDVKTL